MHLPNLTEWANRTKGIAAWVAALLLIPGFIILIYQLHESRKVVVADAVASAFGELSAIHKAFLDHPEMRAIFYEDADVGDQDATRRALALAIADQFLDAFLHMYMLSGLTDEGQSEARDRFVRGMCESSRFLTDFLNANSLYLCDERLREIVREFAAKPRPAPSKPCKRGE